MASETVNQFCEICRRLSKESEERVRQMEEHLEQMKRYKKRLEAYLIMNDNDTNNNKALE